MQMVNKQVQLLIHVLLILMINLLLMEQYTVSFLMSVKKILVMDIFYFLFNSMALIISYEHEWKHNWLLIHLIVFSILIRFIIIDHLLLRQVIFKNRILS